MIEENDAEELRIANVSLKLISEWIRKNRSRAQEVRDEITFMLEGTRIAPQRYVKYLPRNIKYG